MNQGHENRGSAATPFRRWGTNGVSGLLVALRLIFGIMWTSSGIFWMIRDDPAGYVADAIERSLEQEAPPPVVSRPYRAFLDAVVRPHPLLFARLANVGEFLSGVALLLGFPMRAGAAGAIFMATNYALAFDPWLFPPTFNFLIALLHVPLLTPWAYRWMTWGGPKAWRSEEVGDKGVGGGSSQLVARSSQLNHTLQR